MSAPDRRAVVERPGKDLSVRRQCALLSLTRSGVYRSKPVTGADDLAVMRRTDELHLELPFYGSRRMTFELNKEGRGVKGQSMSGRGHLDAVWRLAFRLGFPLARVWWRQRGARPEGALVAVCVDRDLLLVRSSYQVEWNFPGGGVKRGETPGEAARRELSEEIGLVTPRLSGAILA
jgi:hypothetical protein